MTLATAISGLNTLLSSMTGLTRTYADPPEAINEFPCLITYIGTGTMEGGANGGKSLHTVVAEVYEHRSVLAQAANAAKVWPDRVFAKIKADETLGGTVSHIVWPITYTAQPLSYGNAESIHFAVRFRIQVKVNEA